jgi:hypothetical protein
MPPQVAAVFDAFPTEVRFRLLEVRQLIFATAAAIDTVGPLSETLKWGEPAYLTDATKSGSTIRLGESPISPDDCAILFNCHTTLVDSFQERFPGVFLYQGNRAILLRANEPLPELALTECLGMALTYHRRSRACR